MKKVDNILKMLFFKKKIKSIALEFFIFSSDTLT